MLKSRNLRQNESIYHPINHITPNFYDTLIKLSENRVGRTRLGEKDRPGDRDALIWLDRTHVVPACLFPQAAHDR